MQANLFRILAITAAFSTVQSAPVETAEGQVTQGQVNGTETYETPINEAQVNEAQVNEAHVNKVDVDDVVPQKNCVREEAPHISTREREGDIFARSCREYSCHTDSQCIKWGCLECNLYFTPCGDSYTRCY
ncbi:hypothetical protein NCS56_01040100 [Fusarium sp. Ph1]|nr:hypothetical protein NCS56_01040100 [Fusarium sp. Ph1]